MSPSAASPVPRPGAAPSAARHAAPTPGASGRLAGIDGLRAVAMTMVIAQHCGLLPFGWTGVWLFFAISGHVITRGLLVEETQPQHQPSTASRYGAFLRRRLLRIVPAYALYVGLCGLLFGASVGRAGLPDLLGLLSFTYNWRMIFQPADATQHWPAIGHLWTLSVEQQFYIVFPLLFFGLAERWRWRVAAALVLLAPATRAVWLGATSAAIAEPDPGKLAFLVYAATVCQADAFLLGALLARFQTALLRNRGRIVRVCALALACVLLFALVYGVLNHLRGDHGLGLVKNIYSGTLYGQGRELLVYSVINLLAAAVLLATLAGLGGTAWLSSPGLAWVGRVSYGAYLYHALVLWALCAWLGGELKSLPLLPRLGGFVAVLALTLAAAGLSFRWIEQPITRRLRPWAAGSSGTVQLRTTGA